MSKQKVSLALDASVLEAVDREVGGGLGNSRSAVVQQVLAQWARGRRRLALNNAVERYYLELSDEERTEDARWAEMAAEDPADRWDGR